MTLRVLLIEIQNREKKKKKKILIKIQGIPKVESQ